MSEPTPRTWLDSIREQYGSLQSARLSGRKQDEAAATNWLHISVNEHWHDILEMQRTLAAQRTASPLLPGLERAAEIMDPIGVDWRNAGDMAKFYATNYLVEAIRAEISRLRGEGSAP